jgi:hypothetical protein
LSFANTEKNIFSAPHNLPNVHSVFEGVFFGDEIAPTANGDSRHIVSGGGGGSCRLTGGCEKFVSPWKYTSATADFTSSAFISVPRLRCLLGGAFLVRGGG